MTIEKAAGGCHCGAVRYKAFGVADEMDACHCGVCRKISGGPLLARDVARLEYQEGTPVGRYRSSDWAERTFCQKCGSVLAWHMVGGGYTVVAAYSLDEGDAPLSKEIFVDAQPKGYAFAGTTTRMTGAEVEEWAKSLMGS